MMNLTKFAEFLEQKLNALNRGVYKVFADVADYREATREGNTVTRYKNAMLQMNSTDITPIKNWLSAVISCTLTIAIDMDVQATDVETGGYLEVEDVRETLNELVSTWNGQTTTFVDDSTFDVTSYFGSAVVGAVEQVAPIGKMVPISLDCFFTYVENGMNSNDVSIEIDGEEVDFVSGEITRVKTAQANQYSDDKHINTVIQQNGISIDLRLPLLKSTSGREIWSDILRCDEQNKGHLVTIRGKKFTKIGGDDVNSYFMVFGQSSLSLQAAKNITSGLNLVEGKPELMPNIGAPLIFKVQVNLPHGALVSDPFFFGTGRNAYVNWGDSDEIVKVTGPHEYDTSGTYTVKVWGELYAFWPTYDENAAITSIEQWGDIRVQFASFKNNAKLASIPWGSPMPGFKNPDYQRPAGNPLAEQRALLGLFRGCSALSYSYEEDGSCERLLDNFPNADSTQFMFAETNISETPVGIFAPLKNVVHCGNMFSGCSNLGVIYQEFSPNIQFVGGMFENCGTAVDGGIEIHTPLNLVGVTNAENMFKGAKLSSLGNIFGNMQKLYSTESAFENVIWVGDNNVTDSMFGSTVPETLKVVKNMFKNTIASPSGTAPKLWEVSTITSYSGAFNGCTALTNYADIPDTWK